MSNKKLAVLGILAVVMIVLAVLTNPSSKKVKVRSEGKAYLIQGLDPSEIAKIVLGTGSDTITLKREGNRFLVVEKDDYPAKTDAINELITSCLDIKIIEMYTDDKQNHKALGVTEEDARSVIKFFKADSSPLAGVIVGKNKEQGRGTFVRLVSDDKVYLSLSVPRANSNAMGYIDSSLLSIGSEDIESIQVVSPKETYSIKRKASGNEIVLEDIPEGKKQKDDDCKSVFEAATNLWITDVSEGTAGILFDNKYICKLKDSTVYTFDISQKESKSYITCRAEFTDPTPVTKPEAEDSEEDLKKKEALLLGRDNASDFSRKHKGWVYEIGEYNASNMVKKLSELIEDDPNQIKSPPTEPAVSDPNS
jgi:hypothetical protein